MMTTQQTATPCEISTWFKNKNGYASRSRREGEKIRKVYAHRDAWESIHGPIPENMTVHHKCGVKPCVNPLHLELKTIAENTTIGRPCPDKSCGCICHTT